jgi:hypothetical protein
MQLAACAPCDNSTILRVTQSSRVRPNLQVDTEIDYRMAVLQRNIASFIVQLCYCWWLFHIDQLDLLHGYSTFFFVVKASLGKGA